MHFKGVIVDAAEVEEEILEDAEHLRHPSK